MAEKEENKNPKGICSVFGFTFTLMGLYLAVKRRGGGELCSMMSIMYGVLAFLPLEGVVRGG